MRNYGLIGYPLGHSFSAKHFNRKFEEEHLECRYDLYPVSTAEGIRSFMAAHPELLGFNVTIPYKERIMDLLDDMSDEAQAIGAVNVVKREKGKSGTSILKGYNTDFKAFADTLHPLLHDGVKKALVLGTGGAAKAVAYALGILGIQYTYVSRCPEKADVSQAVSYDALDKRVILENLLIVNATPVGMFPDTDMRPPIPYRYLTSEHICYDLVYNPERTLFMKESEKAGAKVCNGMAMLIGQAQLSWDLWTASPDIPNHDI